jgi:hypothetical protein
MASVKRHYNRVRRETAVAGPMNLANLKEPLVVVPIDRWTRLSEKALRFALKLSDEVEAIHVDAEDCGDEVCEQYEQNVVAAFRAAGLKAPPLVRLASPFRFVLTPLVDHVLQLEWKNPDRQIAILIPELVVRQWWHSFLHNQRAQLLKLLLLVRGNGRIIVINIPWYL